MKTSLLILVLSSALLVSCGKKGALYLPEETKTTNQDEQK